MVLISEKQANRSEETINDPSIKRREQQASGDA